jgi:hypothetical protein
MLKLLLVKVLGIAGNNKKEETPMSIKLPVVATCLVLVSLVAGIAGARAAETGTKTMPDSSVYAPPTPPPVFGTYSHHECYLPSEPCDNRHRVTN